MKVIREYKEFAKLRKNAVFLKKMQNNCNYWASRSLLNPEMNINLNICPSGIPKIQISDPETIHKENEMLFFINGHFAMSTCEKNKRPRKRN